MNRILSITLVFAALLIASGTASAQSKLTGDAWAKFKTSAERYDSLQLAIQAIVDANPEFQKNPTALQKRLADDMKDINEIYQAITINADPALSSLGDDYSMYTIDDLMLIKMAAIATKKVDKAVKVDELLLAQTEDRDSTLMLQMELAKYHTYLQNFDEAARYATADVLSIASDQDKLQFYPTIAKGYAKNNDLDKAMLYAFKAMETYEAYRTATAEQLKGTEREESELEMMNRFFEQQYVDLLYTITSMMKDEEMKTSFMTEAEKIVDASTRWGAIQATMKQRDAEEKAEQEKFNKPAPAWAKHDWMGGEDFSLEKLKGKVVLVDFFATWCKPCIMAFPHIREWQEKYADQGLVVTGLTTYQNRYKGKEVTPKEEAEKMKNDFMKEHKITWAVGIESDGRDTFEKYGVQGIPYVVLIDKHGKLRYTKTGAAGYDETEDMIKKLLAEE